MNNRSDDIVLILRTWGAGRFGEDCRRAADEIERLREELRRAESTAELLARGLTTVGTDDV